MSTNFATKGLGTPPPGWLANCVTGALNSIRSTFMQTQSLPTTRPTGIAAVVAGFKRQGVPDEIRGMCLARGLQPDDWVALAKQSDSAAAAVRASLAKRPLLPRR